MNVIDLYKKWWFYLILVIIAIIYALYSTIPIYQMAKAIETGAEVDPNIGLYKEMSYVYEKDGVDEMWAMYYASIGTQFISAGFLIFFIISILYFILRKGQKNKKEKRVFIFRCYWCFYSRII